MINKILTFLTIGIFLISFTSAEIGADIGFNDDGWFIQLFTNLPQTLVNYLVTFPQITNGHLSNGFTYLFLADGNNLELIQDVAYLMSLKNEMLRAQNLFIVGYEYPDFCKRTAQRVTLGYYVNTTTDQLYKVVGDPKCPN